MRAEGIGYRPPQVRGVSLISLKEYLKSRLNEESRERFYSNLHPDDTDIIHQVKKWKWYPFDIHYRLRRQIAMEFKPCAHREAVYDAGLFAAIYETSTFLSAMFSFLSPKTVVSNIQLIWNKYYRPGILTARLDGQNRIKVRLEDFLSDPIFCPMITSWLVIAAQTMGLPEVKVTETSCVHKSGENCSWEISWITSD